MDEQRFDVLTKTLAAGVSRRRVLRGAAAGLAAAVGLRVSRAGAGQAKLPVCHYTGSESNPWELIEVAEPAYLTHLGHGDQPYVDCCDDATCSGSDTCGGGGTPGACGCTPTFTLEDCDGVTCGEIPNGCGATVTCGCLGTDACDDTGTCVATFCGSYVLAGAGGIGDTFGVDDDIDIFLNGNLLFRDHNHLATEVAPIAFTATGGDVISFSAANTFGGCQSMEGVVLYCADGSATQTVTTGFAFDGICSYPASESPFFTGSVAIGI